MTTDLKAIAERAENMKDTDDKLNEIAEKALDTVAKLITYHKEWGSISFDRVDAREAILRALEEHGKQVWDQRTAELKHDKQVLRQQLAEAEKRMKWVEEHAMATLAGTQIIGMENWSGIGFWQFIDEARKK
jgi:type IV secretory pathway VirJ component